MSNIKFTNQTGFIFKKEALNRVGISIGKLSSLLELEILDENSDLISMKPCYPDRCKFLIDELKKEKLEYVDDYFILEIDLPAWLSLRGEIIIE
jgi:hypothetical protein